MTRGTDNFQENQACVTLLEVKMNFPGCSSLKEKRSRLKPIIARIKKDFNASAAETGLYDIWQSAYISCVIVTNSSQLNTSISREILHFIETQYPDEILENYHIEPR